MSVHSIDHTDSEVTNRSYKGYHIDTEGKVTEFYDHRDDEGAASSVAMSQPSRPLVNTNGNVSNVATSRSPAQRKVRYRNAGCCDSCVSLLVTIGTMPFATAFALLCSWAGTAMFVGAGWAALDETLDLFAKYGPNSGNPATDSAPQYIYAPGSFSGEFILRDDNDLGNRVPEVFQAIKYSFYAIIPFMLIFTIVVACDNRRSSRAVVSKQRSCKTSSSGICCTSGLIFCTYVLILAWVFWLAFTTLGVYYYRISMLRCSDLKYRAYPEGVWRSICIDLVQLGVIMFQNTNDNGFGKICGPGENTRGYGKLDEYCENYFVVYQYMLVCFSGILLNIIAMINFMMILTTNYNNLTRRHMRPKRNTDDSTTVVATSYRSTPAPTTAPNSIATGLPPYRGTPETEFRERRPSRGNDLDQYRNRRRSRDIDIDYRDPDYRARRSSKDIELDYLVDGESSVGPHRELDSHVGVNYYYR